MPRSESDCHPLSTDLSYHAVVVLSFSRPDPSSPTAVAGATFSPSRRGYDQDEVRDYLRMVSAELSRLHDQVVYLEHELAERSKNPLVSSLEITEDTVVELLGEETARIVQTAREAAHKIKARSEETAAKLIREASEEAARLREESELDCARRRQDATADAEAEVLMAKQQGRDMVNEARAYRERVLADVARRREMAREQLEDLFHGRDRLVQAFERARTATDDVLRDLNETTEEPTEFINLAPTTGPVPVIVQADEVERIEAFRPTTSSAPSFAPYDQDLDINVEPLVVEPDVSAVVEAADLQSPLSQAEIDDHIDVDDDEDLYDDAPVDKSERVVDLVEAKSPVAISKSNVVPLFARTDQTEQVAEVETPVESAPVLQPADSDPADSPIINQKSAVVKADDIFARLRRASTDVVAKDATSQQRSAKAAAANIAPEAEKSEPTRRVVTPASNDTACFDRRNEDLVPVIVSMSRKIKKVLADEQNLILDALRAKQPVKTLDILVGSKAEHSSRFTRALEPLLNTASLAGARSLSNVSDAELTKKVHHQKQSIDDFVASTLVAPLRERLSRSISDASGSNAELATLIRSVYREWKNQFVDEHVDDIALNAYGRGALAVLDQKAGYCWLVDPDGPACSDAEDNSLAGAVRGGAEFPTGHTHAPAHPGCRCALVVCDN